MTDQTKPELIIHSHAFIVRCEICNRCMESSSDSHGLADLVLLVCADLMDAGWRVKIGHDDDPEDIEDTTRHVLCPKHASGKIPPPNRKEQP